MQIRQKSEMIARTSIQGGDYSSAPSRAVEAALTRTKKARRFDTSIGEAAIPLTHINSSLGIFYRVRLKLRISIYAFGALR